MAISRVGFSTARTWLMGIALMSLQACRWGYENSNGAELSASAGNGAQSGASSWNTTHAVTVPRAGSGGDTPRIPMTTVPGGGAMNGGTTVSVGGTASSSATASIGGTTVGGSVGTTASVGGTASSSATPSIGGTTVGGSVGTTSPASTLVLSGMNLTALHGGTTTTPYSDVCPGNTVLVGVQGTVSKVGVTLVSSLQGLCANLALSADGTAITTGTTTETPLRGGTGNAWKQICPANHVIVGFEGRAGACLDSLAIRCGSLARQGSAVTVSPGSTLPAVGGKGGEPFTEGCPEGQIARALNLFVLDGSWVDAMGLVCGALTITN